MVPRKVEEVATIWAIQLDLVVRFYHEWHLGEQPVVTVCAFDFAGKGHTKTMDRDGIEVVVH